VGAAQWFLAVNSVANVRRAFLIATNAINQSLDGLAVARTATEIQLLNRVADPAVIRIPSTVITVRKIEVSRSRRLRADGFDRITP
jgi:hypothetical protein